MTELEYLEDERKKLWNKVTEIENDVKKKSSDSEKEAKQHSKKASEFRNKCESALELAMQYSNEAKSNLDKTESIKKEVLELKNLIAEFFKEADESNDSINEYYQSINERKEKIETDITKLEELFEKHEDYSDNIATLESFFEDGEVINTKINTLHKLILSKKKEIDGMYSEIFGYTEEGESGDEEAIHIEGLRDKLESSYDKLIEQQESLKKDIELFKESANTNYTNLVTDKQNDFSSVITKWEKEYKSVLDKIKSLLPQALTTGLSHAYSEKKKIEEIDSAKLANKFRTATYGLVAVSIIPFAISILSWFSGKELQQLIIDMPRLVLAILPLYVPVLWLAYSANKKLNLSKRLIEEYTHKEVLSKTYEGLSTQTAEIRDDRMSMELKNKLLHNLISVSSENPGKLISDYNKSDHPLSDTLEKSLQLVNSVEKLADFPGMNKITSLIGKKSKKLIEETKQKVEVGLDLINEVDEEEKE